MPLWVRNTEEIMVIIDPLEGNYILDAYCGKPANVIFTDSFCTLRPGYRAICQETLRRKTKLLIRSGFAHPKHIWVLDSLEYKNLVPSCKRIGSYILFSLALSILLMGCQSILAQGIWCLRTQWCRISLFLHLRPQLRCGKFS